MNSDEKFSALVNNALDERVEHMDGATQSQLMQARQRALEVSTRPWYVQHLLPLAASAACGLGAAIFLLNPAAISDSQTSLPATELAMLGIELEMLEELEMIEWIADADEAGVAPEAYEAG